MRAAAIATAVALIHAILVLQGLAPTRVQAEPLPLWEAGFGATVLSFPDYRGSNERTEWVLPFPYLVYRGEYLKADERRVRGLFFRTETIEVDFSLNGTVPVNSSENEARKGMPDLDATVEIGPALNVLLQQSDDRKARLELRLPVRAVLASDFSYVRQVGWVFQPNLNLDIRDVLGNAGWKTGLQGGPIFSDRRHNRYFFGVDPAFATADRPAYSPGGGYSGTQFTASLSKRFREFWVGGFARWDVLSNAVFADSPLVKTEQNFSAGIAVAWMLGESKARVEVP